MNTKQLIKSLENKSTFAFAWSILWRTWVIVMGIQVILLALMFFMIAITGLVVG